MSDRVPCSNAECPNTILPATARANDGLCAPCATAIAEKEHAEYVRLNRRTVDLYAGVIDPVHMAEIMLTPRRHDELIAYAPPPVLMEDLFAGLDAAAAARLSAVAVSHLAAGRTKLAEALVKRLALLSDHDLSVIQQGWVAHNHFEPDVAFRSAAPATRDFVIRAIDQDAPIVLSALAWIGDEFVARALQRWDEEMPPWTAGLRVRPSLYARAAGWEVVDGKRRNLFHTSCHALVTAEAGHGVSPVKTFSSVPGDCPWCGQSLSHMLELSGEDFSSFGFSGPRLPVVTCHRCTCYGIFFGKVDEQGLARPHPSGPKPQWLPDQTTSWDAPGWRDVPVRLTPRRATQAVDWCMELKNSQIGGMPCWVQDAEYPQCPDCAKTMQFIGQLDEGDFPEGEGMYYAFWCAPCRTTATSYQQT